MHFIDIGSTGHFPVYATLWHFFLTPVPRQLSLSSNNTGEAQNIDLIAAWNPPEILKANDLILRCTVEFRRVLAKE